MKLNKSFGYGILLLFILVGGFYILNSVELFSTVATTTTPKWKFVNGCIEGKCYDGTYFIGELELTTGAPFYLKEKSLCQFNDRWLTFEDTPESCWKQSFSFDGTEYTLYPYQKARLNDYLEVTWVPSGFIFNGEVCHAGECETVDYGYDWKEPTYSNEFTFNFFNTDFMNTIIKDKHLSDTLGDSSFVTYQINNDLTTMNGGAVVREKHELWNPSNFEKTDFFKIHKGNYLYKTTVETETLGDKEITINPFIIVEEVKMGSAKGINVFSNYDSKELRILPNLENIPDQDADFWGENQVASSSKKTTQEQKIFYFFVLALIIVVVATFTRRKNG